MPSSAEFGLLGPLLVRVDGVVVPVSRGKQRVLLAALLLRAGRMVPADQLAEMMWDQRPPPSAAVTLQNYVKRLRRALGTAGQDRIITQPGGYLIRVEPGELDLAAMEHALAAARRGARDTDWPRVAREAAAALALWRGEPLCDVDLPPQAAPEVSRLAELRVQACELRIEADLHLARHGEIVTELAQLVAAAPLREHLRALLMLALYRSGRRAEALEAYQRARDVLVGELGSEPGPELQALHRQVLSDDPALSPPAQPAARSSPAAPAQARAVPRQLPAPVGCFTGRDRELAVLTGLLGSGMGGRAPALVISAIGGTAGVGKTALAVQWAHQVAEHFPDGQLYVNLRGYDPRDPVPAADALARFLHALGVPGHDIPDGAEERSGLYRSRLAGRRILVVLDNARDGEHVRPLLPGDPGCVAVVTSRDALAGLVATDGARRLDLDVLPLADAVTLLRSLIGARADEDPAAAADLARLCARLPLALRIAAELAAADQAAPLAGLVAELGAARLDRLDAGEDRADVRAVFSWSCRQLPGNAAGMFALIGQHPGGDLDAHAAAAFTATTPAQARQMLARLHRASLVQPAGPGRYGMHDLLRAYSREQATALGTNGTHQALTRLFDYYRAAAAAAIDVAFPAEMDRRPRIPPSVAVVPELAGEADARAWLDRERANLVAVVVHCADHGWPRHAAGLAGVLFRYLMVGSHLPEAQTIYRHALTAAEHSGDLTAQAEALNGLGGIALRQGRFRDAAPRYQAALKRFCQRGDRAGQARAMYNLGYIEHELHNLQSAVSYYRESMAASEDAGIRIGTAAALCRLAGAETELDDLDLAYQHLQQALAIVRDQNDQNREAEALAWIGRLSLRRGQLTQAASHFQQSLSIFRHIGNRAGEADVLRDLAQVSVGKQAPQQAVSLLGDAIALLRQTGAQHNEIQALIDLARTLRGTGQLAAARNALQTALGLATETGNTYEQASTHREIGECHYSANEREQARQHWQLALTLYAQLGAHDEQAQVRSRLHELETGTRD